MLHVPCQMQEMQEGKLYICYKGAPTHQLKKSNKHQAPPTNEWKLLDLGVWWKYPLVGHVWVHGSKLSSFSLCCFLENDTSLHVLGFGMKNWVLCNTYGTGAITLKWNMSILLTKVTHGICDPKEVRRTTSCGNILCLGSGVSNTRLCGKTKTPRTTPKTGKSRNWSSYPTDTGKIRVREHEEPKKKTRSTKRRSLECDGSTWKCAWPLANVKSLETVENERTDIPRTGCPASSSSSEGMTRSGSGTPFGPRVHLPHPL
jgi:hypothetical protein